MTTQAVQRCGSLFDTMDSRMDEVICAVMDDRIGDAIAELEAISNAVAAEIGELRRDQSK